MKNILITGASGGLGKALAIEYAKSDSTICLLARNEAKLNNLATKLKLYGSQIHVIKCDVSVKEEVNAAFDKAAQLMGGIDLAYLNAGVNGSDSFEKFDTDNLERIFSINVFGLAYGLEKLISIMKSRGGIIAGVGSLADARGIPGSSAYCASKAAAAQLLEAARVELRSSKLKIVSIRPGFVRTEMTAKLKFPMPFLMDVDKAAKIIMKKISVGKSRVAFPSLMTLLSYIGRAMPSPLYEFLVRLRKVYK